MPVLSTTRELSRTTQSDKIFRQLEREIVSGELPMGSKLGEEALAERFRVSRGPLREALRQLEGRSLVVRSAHAGARVTSLTEQDVNELYMLRQTLEGLSARLAAENRTEDDLEEVAKLLALGERAVSASQDKDLSQDAERHDFHFLVAQASKSRRLQALLCGELYSLIRLCRFKTWGLPDHRRVLEDHRRILEAIAERDGELAELLMKRHVALARKRVQDAWESDTLAQSAPDS